MTYEVCVVCIRVRVCVYEVAVYRADVLNQPERDHKGPAADVLVELKGKQTTDDRRARASSIYVYKYSVHAVWPVVAGLRPNARAIRSQRFNYTIYIRVPTYPLLYKYIIAGEHRL